MTKRKGSMEWQKDLWEIIFWDLTLHTAHFTLNTAHCTLHTAHRAAHSTLHTAHCTLHTEHCTLHTAHCLNVVSPCKWYPTFKFMCLIYNVKIFLVTDMPLNPAPYHSLPSSRMWGWQPRLGALFQGLNTKLGKRGGRGDSLLTSRCCRSRATFRRSEAIFWLFLANPG